MTSQHIKDNQIEDGGGTRHAEKGISKLAMSIEMSGLPSMLQPKYRAKQREAVKGTALVLVLILFFVGLTHGVALEMIDGFAYGGTTWWVFCILIYVEALAAILCLHGLWLVDPGVVKRSRKTSFPIPIEMQQLIEEYLHDSKKDKQFSPPTEHYFTADDGSGDTYCTRCLVWRRKEDGRHYHCNTCQRCVMQYDHHCSVFGRCIAGKMCGLRGNYKYFVMICCCGVLALWTTCVALVWSLSIIYGAEWVVPFALCILAYLMMSMKLHILGPQILCLPCQRGTSIATDRFRRRLR